jgi:5-methylcytosine-specific restriction endonuclease McrA
MGALAQKKVLVLNKHSVAVGVVSLQRAIIMLFSFDPKTLKPKAEIIDEGCQPWTWEEWALLRPEDNEDAINSCQGRFKIPEIIKLSKYDKMPQHQIHFSRRMIHKRDGSQCMYCRARPGTEELTIDHIIPRSKGGLTTWENCVLACVPCNSNKANRMPDRTTVVDHVKDDHGKLKEVHVPAFTVYFNDKTRKTIRQPKKPNFEVFRGEIPYKSWAQWLNVAYWNVELENDN